MEYVVKRTPNDELMHYGVKGMKWGVRRYQNYDGSYKHPGDNRYASSGKTKTNKSQSYTTKHTTNASSSKSQSSKKNDENSDGSNSKKLSTKQKVAIGIGIGGAAAVGGMIAYKAIKNWQISRGERHIDQLISNEGDTKVADFIKKSKMRITGKQYVDSYIKQGTEFSRIQSTTEFGDNPFYATYKKDDVDKYMGLFGKNLYNRSNGDVSKVYQVKLSNTKKLKIPSDDNASKITANLLKEKDFKDNVIASISDSKTKMKRPNQQALFAEAQAALKKDPGSLTNKEKTSIYKAFNLSLTNHNEQEIAAQKRFYSELKKHGYSALLDYNDKQYSSYHAKRPVIVFDTDAVKLQSVMETNPKMVNKLNTVYNAERIMKEIPTNTIGFVGSMGRMTYAKATEYSNSRMTSYLAG